MSAFVGPLCSPVGQSIFSYPLFAPKAAWRKGLRAIGACVDRSGDACYKAPDLASSIPAGFAAVTAQSLRARKIRI
jgi:hypothetical protein